MSRLAASRTEKRCRDDRDPVRPTVGGGSSSDDHGVQQAVTDLALKPMEVPHVMIGWHTLKLDFDGEDSPIAFNDQVYFVVAAVRAQVAHARLGGLCVRPDGLRNLDRYPTDSIFSTLPIFR